MKRDWDTIRKILTKLEESASSDTLRLSNFPPEKAEEISYHIELLPTLGKGPTSFYITRLTWNGHEFLDAINNDTIWEKTKKSFSKNGISMTFELVKTVATETAASVLKSALGN